MKCCRFTFVYNHVQIIIQLCCGRRFYTVPGGHFYFHVYVTEINVITLEEFVATKSNFRKMDVRRTYRFPEIVYRMGSIQISQVDKKCIIESGH